MVAEVGFRHAPCPLVGHEHKVYLARKFSRNVFLAPSPLAGPERQFDRQMFRCEYYFTSLTSRPESSHEKLPIQARRVKKFDFSF